MAQHGSGVVVMEPALVKFLLRKASVKREEKQNFQSILAGVAPILGAGGMVQTGFAGFWMVPKWCLNVPLLLREDGTQRGRSWQWSDTHALGKGPVNWRNILLGIGKSQPEAVENFAVKKVENKVEFWPPSTGGQIGV